MISNLPLDLKEEILSRVPVTSLRRLRSTCKGWYHHALFKDPGFIKKHFDKTPRQYKALLLTNYRVYSMRSSLKQAHITNALFTKELFLIDPHCKLEVNILEAFHCDGILLCTTLDRKLVVWNPFSGKTRWIQVTQPINICFHRSFALGYDNKQVCHSYKILRIYWLGHLRIVEIYEFRSNSWRYLDVSDVSLGSSRIECSGVSLKGNTYWLSSRSRGGVLDYSLLSFVFSTEIFQYLRAPPFHRQEPDNCFGSMSLSVVREEHLSLLCQDVKTRKVEIWVTNEIETTFVSWSKFLSVELKPMFSRYMSFFIDEEKKVAFCLENERDSKSNVTIVGEDGYIVTPGLSCNPLDYRINPINLRSRSAVFRYVPRLV